MRWSAIVMMFLLAGCSRETPAPADVRTPPAAHRPAPEAQSGSPGNVVPLTTVRIADLSEQQRRFGLAVRPDARVVFQPGLVIIEDGPEVVNALAEDGMGCTLDSAAVETAGLRVGQVTFITSRCVGRVLAMIPKGRDVELILGPVEITEIIREGNFTLDQPVDFSQVLVHEAPQWPGAPGAEPAFRAVADGPATRSEPVMGASLIGARIPYSSNGVDFLGEVTLHLQEPRLYFVLDIRGGKVTRAEVELYGAARLAGNMAAHSPNGNNLALKPYQLPFDTSIPIGGAIPFSILLHHSFTVATHFGSKNSHLANRAEYKLEGAFRMGYRDNKWDVGSPARLTVIHEPLDNIEGVTLAPGFLAFTHQLRVMVGIGAFGFATGPYMNMATTIAISRGSDLAGGGGDQNTVRTPLFTAKLGGCRQAAFTMAMGAGVGYSVPRAITDAINSVLNALNIDYRVGNVGGLQTKLAQVLKRQWWSPDNSICRLT